MSGFTDQESAPVSRLLSMGCRGIYRTTGELSHADASGGLRHGVASLVFPGAAETLRTRLSKGRARMPFDFAALRSGRTEKTKKRDKRSAASCTNRQALSSSLRRLRAEQMAVHYGAVQGVGLVVVFRPGFGEVAGVAWILWAFVRVHEHRYVPRVLIGQRTAAA
jgi:hypothetical protein